VRSSYGISLSDGFAALPSKKPKSDNVDGLGVDVTAASETLSGAAEVATAAVKHARNGNNSRINGR
jgi:hypothetical protein